MGLADMLSKLDEEKNKDLATSIDNFLTERRLVPPMVPGQRIYASNIGDFCPREEAICVEKNISREDVFSAKTQRNMRVGRAFEKIYRDEVMGKMGIVLGRWKCMSCGHSDEMVDGTPRYRRPEKCWKCKDEKGEFSFMEEKVFDESANISGKCDGFLYWNFDYYILELKAVNDRYFKMVKKNGPFENHTAQLQIYLKNYGYKKGVFWYLNKDSGDEIHFWVDFKPEYATYLGNKAREMKTYFYDHVFPKRICVNSTCPRAEDCGRKELCFGEFDGR